MALNGIGGSFYKNEVMERKKTGVRQTKDFDNDFVDSIAKSQDSKEAVRQDVFKSGSDEVSKEFIYSKFDTSFGGIEELADTNLSDAVSICQGKNITFEISDSVRVCVLQGYVLEAAVSDDGSYVYVKQKNEDGTAVTYEVDLSKVSENTDNPIEQMALQSASGSQEKQADKEWQKAMKEFSAFVEDRIKNGPPKYMIGAQELSIDEWDRLIEHVDKAIDNIQEEQKERIEKVKEREKAEEEI
jgi:hypothetical protein